MSKSKTKKKTRTSSKNKQSMSFSIIKFIGNKIAKKKLLKYQEEDWKIVMKHCVKIPYPGFSENYMYERTFDGRIIRTDAYNKWWNNFPEEYLKEITRGNKIDFNKPIKVYYAFDHLEKYDYHNFLKSINDRIAAYYSATDHYIRVINSKSNKIVTRTKDCYIYVYMFNI